MTTLLTLVGDRKVTPEAYQGPYAELIQAWMREGTAAGNAGDLYVNRDEDRTQIATEKFPLLTSVMYGEEAQMARAHVGAANGAFSSGLVTHPVVGTSLLSLANTPFWRSLPRLVTTEAAADALSQRMAMANQLYIYDASSDYSKQFKGDLLTAAVPQILISCDRTSQQPNAKQANETLAELVLAGMAAMRPETKQEMLRRGLLVPTMQMLLRKSVKGAPEYCSAAAHPIAFDPAEIEGEAFVRAAHALMPDQLPTIVQLAMRREAMPRQYIDYFDAPTSERISDTTWSIKRVVRSIEKTRKMTVSAASAEAGVTYHWFVVSGDPQKVRFRALTKDAALMTIEVDYHGAFEQNGIATRHVDIACIALRKGEPASAPSFVSLRYLANERRVYDEAGKIQQVDYTPPENGFVYEDPALSAFKNWKDDYHYDANGRLSGWTRTLANGTQQQFDARGRRILELNPDGSAKRVVEVNYFPRTDSKSNAVTSPAIELLPVDTERTLTL
jgi:YD repeat-containing protein